MITQRTGRAMNLVCIFPGSRYLVLSASGEQYHITYAGSGNADPDYVGLWDCSCPAGLHGRDCKHMRAFLGSAFLQADHCEGDAIKFDARGNATFEPVTDRD